ncbi:KGK domain-containing protein [Anabaena sp. UHCC 0451]|uniref:KGK domain-containing protein n=1 Tax=Anabaena sp. UHCC 0451 TaxID=2055235 RepID=UPI002B20BAED|nr:KGK domain-containing protein [Anabaena sp. UHCC 0451]MEA5579543.1 KGK domain-containing protein [Anabaena sp. UHCC 0451]
MSNSILDDNDVVLAISDNGERTYKVRDFLKIIKQIFAALRNGNYLEQCLEDGGECQVLKSSGGGWIPGKIRIRIEFIPDKPQAPQSPLDDLRSELK